MSKYTLSLLMLLASLNVARGQTSYTYRYWTDNDVTTQLTGRGTGEQTFILDIGLMSAGMHALHVQACGADGTWSAVETQFFFKAEETEAAVSGRYWFDNDYTTVHSVATTGTISLDIARLGEGFHAVHYCTVRSDGVPSSTHTQFFFKATETEAGVSGRYWFDNDYTTMHDVAANGIIGLDITKLPIGFHAVHYYSMRSDGIPSSTQTQFFYVDQVQIGTLSATIWIDGDTEGAANYALTDKPIVIDVQKLPVGMHQLTVRLIDSHNLTIGEKTVDFEVLPRMATITLMAAMETFSHDEDLNFKGVSGLRAYTAGGFNTKTGSVVMHRVTDVPAGTGILLLGTPGNTYKVPCEEAFTVYVNMLEPTPADNIVNREADGYLNYLLSEADGEFSRASDGSWLDDGRAYLRLPGGKAAGTRRVSIVFNKDLPGDVNEDSSVDVADIATVISCMAGGTVAPSTQQLGDVNDDGVIDVADIANVISIMASQARQQRQSAGE